MPRGVGHPFPGRGAGPGGRPPAGERHLHRGPGPRGRHPGRQPRTQGTARRLTLNSTFLRESITPTQKF